MVIPYSRQSYAKTEDVWTDMEPKFICDQAICPGNLKHVVSSYYWGQESGRQQLKESRLTQFKVSSVHSTWYSLSDMVMMYMIYSLSDVFSYSICDIVTTNMLMVFVNTRGRTNPTACYRPTNPHRFAMSLTISAAISRSHRQRFESHDFFAELANSHRLSVQTHGFAPPS